MTVTVVDLLEVIDVDDQQGERALLLPLGGQPFQQGAAIGQLGQLIEGGQLVEVARAAVQPVGGDAQQQQGTGQQAYQRQLVVASALLMQQLLALVLVLLLQHPVAGLAAARSISAWKAAACWLRVWLKCCL